jgi:tol-pal system protein YbgF
MRRIRVQAAVVTCAAFGFVASARADSAHLQEYVAAFELLKRAEWEPAAQAFRAFIAAHPDDALAGHAQYWLGRSDYARDRFEEAATAFAEVDRLYPDSPKWEDALLGLGQSLIKLERAPQACAALGRLSVAFRTKAARTAALQWAREHCP